MGTMILICKYSGLITLLGSVLIIASSLLMDKINVNDRRYAEFFYSTLLEIMAIVVTVTFVAAFIFGLNLFAMFGTFVIKSIFF